MEPRGAPEFERPPHLRFLRKHIWLITAALGVVTLTALRPMLRKVPDAPPVMFELPAFTLTDHHGQPFDRGRLEGQITIASFVFTSCPSSCPAVTRAMAQLQERYDDHRLPMKLVSFTVDPETDTPETLARYAETVSADPERWAFVTGDLTDVRSLLEGGFRLGVGDKQAVDGGPMYDIAHSTKLALIGPDGGVRGYYDIDEMGLDEVFHRSQHVLREYKRKK